MSDRFKLVECKNCGCLNHYFDKCTHPIVSYGIILNHNDKYLLTQRKFSLSLIEILKGRFPRNDFNFIKALLCGLSKHEFEQIKECENYDDFIKIFWNENVSYLSSRKEYKNNKTKFKKIIKVLRSDSINTLRVMDENEWGFPKGRRNVGEVPLSCAIREFTEETGISKHKIKIKRKPPLLEIFIGTNGKKYKHCYYEAHFTGDDEETKSPIILDHNDEISKIEWFTKTELLGKIRDYYSERKNLISSL